MRAKFQILFNFSHEFLEQNETDKAKESKENKTNTLN